jgi:uncharacterized membrane protein YczE
MKHAAPRLRGGRLARFALLIGGLAVFSGGIVCIYQSRLGLAPWDVLNQGIAKHTPLSFGEANVVVSLLVLGLAVLLGSPVGLGTVANALLVGTFIDQYLRIGAVTRLAGEPFAVRVGLLAGGISLMGAATGLYIGAGFGAGPRDSLMLAVSRRTKARIWIVRSSIEALAVVSGFLMGGTVGVGTLVFVLTIGPAVEVSFVQLARSPLALRPFRVASI